MFYFLSKDTEQLFLSAGERPRLNSKAIMHCNDVTGRLAKRLHYCRLGFLQKAVVAHFVKGHISWRHILKCILKFIKQIKLSVVLLNFTSVHIWSLVYNYKKNLVVKE